MWWSKAGAALIAILPVLAYADATIPLEITCPAVPGARQTNVQVFDGPPADGASLIADSGDMHHGTWALGYVYDSRRVVSVQCGYADGQTREIVLKSRVDTCSYLIDKSGSAHLSCK